MSSKQKQVEEQKDFRIINVDDYKPKENFPDPMLEEVFMDDEVEMEEAEEDLIMDIDSGDKKNPLVVVEYINDLYAYYKKAESSCCVTADYMSTQFDINDRMRGILIDWLIEVHYKFELMQETLYLTVNLIDRFLAILTCD